MTWSTRNLLDFSYSPAINSALEGTWAHGDPLSADDLDSTLSGRLTYNDSDEDHAAGAHSDSSS